VGGGSERLTGFGPTSVKTFRGADSLSDQRMSPRHRQVLELLLSIDRGRGFGIGRQIEAQLRETISAGRLPVGTPLPSSRALAEDLAVSRGVVTRAYRQLAAEGYISLRQGANPCVNGYPATQRQNGSDEAYRFDLRPDLPDLANFPRSGWLRAQQRALRAASTRELANIDGRGLWALRAELAAYLGRSRGLLARPETVFVTSGTSHSLSLLTQALASKGLSAIAFENPSCALHHTAVRQTGFEPRGVRVDEQGLIVSELLAIDAGAVVVAPTHQFPMGARLSESRRAELIQWALQTDGLIIECDSELRDNTAPVASLQKDAPDRVIYFGSTRKTLGPFARLGWAVLPDGFIPSVQELSTSPLHVSSFDQLAFADFLAGGDYDRHIHKMRAVYRKRRAVLIDALQRAFPDSVITGPTGGLHVVLLTGRTGFARRVCAFARDRGVALDEICDHALPGFNGPEGLLVGFGQISEAAVPGVVEELQRAFAAAASSA
jgi:GntR family transcriptional regulator / MocR family aminotransferase